MQGERKSRILKDTAAVSYRGLLCILNASETRAVPQNWMFFDTIFRLFLKYYQKDIKIQTVLAQVLLSY
jgi:hypothetical protein